MKWKYLLVFVFCFSIKSICIAQDKPKEDTAYVNKLIAESKSNLGSDTAKAIALAKQAIAISKKINYPTGTAYALKNLGMVYFSSSKYVETLDYWKQSLEVFKKINDDVGSSNMLNNIGAIYFNQGLDAKALEYSLESLQIAEKINDTLRIFSALTTIGSIYHNKKDPVALDYLLRALPLCERSKDTASYIVIAGDIGEVYYDKNENEKALEYFEKALQAATDETTQAFSYNGIGKVYLREKNYAKAFKNHQKALDISQKLNDKLQVLRSLRGLGDLYFAENNNELGISFYEQARKIGVETDAYVELKEIYQILAEAYAKKKDFTNAYLNQTLYSTVKDTLFNKESAIKLNKLQFDFDLTKKEGEIFLKDAEVKAQRQAKIGFAIGLGFIALFAFVIYRNYLQKSKTNKILDKQKDEIEHLLLNILPAEIANELQVKGESLPRHFDNVSVLFTDFKGFTAIADKLSPTELVKELNECFVAFDDIIGKYGLEKIKTIGDSYMCAGNIPSPLPNHPYKIVKAGIEIQQFIQNYNEKRLSQGLAPWEIRIGIHIGPVVAGVVGKKKYAYDIWGGTVNIASRMESNGDPGKVNVSEATYNIIKDQFACSYRGKINAKNIGEIDMYFVEHEIVSSVIN